MDVDSLVQLYGPNPQEVGAEDGTEDDWGDLVYEVAVLLGRDPDHMSTEDWEHFQAVAIECRATNMEAWIAHLEAIS